MRDEAQRAAPLLRVDVRGGEGDGRGGGRGAGQKLPAVETAHVVVSVGLGGATPAILAWAGLGV